MTKKYNVIYADPPWSYNNKVTGRTDGNQPEGSGAGNHYIEMSLEDLAAMPIDKITENDCVCFMWATTPLLPEAMELLKSWGFKYKTMIVWEKEGLLGMGHWLRIQTEFLLIGVKGKPKPFKHQEKNVYRHRAGKHSQKPHFFRELVGILSAKSFEATIKLEMFARSREGFFPDYEYEGWDVYGNEVNNSIKMPEK